jgi:hypothetical protein
MSAADEVSYPRELPAEYLPHAERTVQALGHMYESGRGFIHWSAGLHWVEHLRTKADEMERQVLSMRVIATFLEENQ